DALVGENAVGGGELAAQIGVGVGHGCFLCLWANSEWRVRNSDASAEQAKGPIATRYSLLAAFSRSRSFRGCRRISLSLSASARGWRGRRAGSLSAARTGGRRR